MADTQFEHSMDDYVMQNLNWRTWVQYKNQAGNWVTNEADIKEGLDYRVGFRVRNGGSETYAKNVQIRVANPYPARITYYTDGTYNQQTNQVNSEFPDILPPGQETPWHWVYIRLGTGRDENVSIANVGVYAEIIPQGHHWRDFFAPLD